MDMQCRDCPKVEKPRTSSSVLRCPYEPGVPKTPTDSCERHEASQRRELLRCPKCGAHRSKITLDHIRVLREHYKAKEVGHVFEFEDFVTWTDYSEDRWEYSCFCGHRWPLDSRSRAALLYRLCLKSRVKRELPPKDGRVRIPGRVIRGRWAKGETLVFDFIRGTQVKVVTECCCFGKTGTVLKTLKAPSAPADAVQVQLYSERYPRYFGVKDLEILPGLPGPGSSVRVLRDAWKHQERGWDTAKGCTAQVLEVVQNADLIMVELKCAPENVEPPEPRVRWYRATYLEVL
jgi:hypothetical protein